MPGKSRRKKAKYSSQSKKATKSNRTVTSPVQAVGSNKEQSVAATVTTTPSPKATIPVAKPAIVRNLYITHELKTIGILAGILLIGLVVLNLTFA